MADTPTTEEITAVLKQAQAHLKSRQPRKVLRVLGPILSHVQSMPPALITYARALGLLGQFQESVKVYRTACGQVPSNVSAGIEFALMLKRCGQHDQAIDQIRKVRALRGQGLVAQSVFIEADLLIDVGQHENAIKLMSLYMREASQSERTAQNMAKCCSAHIRLVPEYISPASIIEEALMHSMNQEVSSGLRSLLCAQAASMLEILSRFDEAIEAQAMSKQLRGLKWDPKSHTDRINCGIAAWTSEAASKLPLSKVDGSGILFIVGMPRCGTSLLEQMLAGHPKIQPLGERNELTFAAASLQSSRPGEIPIVSDFSGFTAEVCQKVAQQAAATINALRHPGMAYVIDKQPFNYAQVPLMAKLLPGCRVIHLRRDPRDTCISYYMQWFMGAHGQANSLETLGQYYSDYMRMMEAWEALQAPSYRPEMLDVQYEHIVTEPEPVMREILEFLELDYDPAVLDHTKNDRVVPTASMDQVKKELYTHSVKRWEHYQKHLGPLERHAGQYFDK